MPRWRNTDLGIQILLQKISQSKNKTKGKGTRLDWPTFWKERGLRFYFSFILHTILRLFTNKREVMGMTVWSQSNSFHHDTQSSIFLRLSLSLFFSVIPTSKPKIKTYPNIFDKNTHPSVVLFEYLLPLTLQRYIFSYCIFNFLASFNGHFILTPSKVFVPNKNVLT